MIRKIAACAVIALVPGFAFAAGASTNVPVPADTHAVGTTTKADAGVKSEPVKTDATAKTNAAVKTDAVAKPGKAVRHRVTNKTTDEKSKAGSTSDSKVDSPKL
jgi:hypothetical protein